MSGPSGRRKQKVKWSKLYTFACLRPSTTDSTPTQSLLGQPGFSRVVFCNEPQLHKIKPHRYPNNYVSTTKYNLLTFLPRVLLEQFCRVANLYFFLVAALSITPLTPFTPISLIAPLVFVMGISMLKEAVEDWHRSLQDRNVNSQKVKVYVGNGLFVQKSWQSLCVGDVVKVSKNEYFPSDLLLLSSSYEEGVYYVETMNLDGETNLKAKRSLEATLYLDDDEEFSRFKVILLVLPREVSRHQDFQDSRCFYSVSVDGAKQDFSYRKYVESSRKSILTRSKLLFPSIIEGNKLVPAGIRIVVLPHVKLELLDGNEIVRLLQMKLELHPGAQIVLRL